MYFVVTIIFVFMCLHLYVLQLCFKKGDIITVTQREEGGWWEGTLDDKTGWFPSNYTKEHKPPGIVKIFMNTCIKLFLSVMSN